jgi:hypothetical protein
MESYRGFLSLNLIQLQNIVTAVAALSPIFTFREARILKILLSIPRNPIRKEE